MAEKESPVRKNEAPAVQSVQTPTPAPRTERLEELDAIKSLFKDYGNTLAYGLAAVLAVILGVSGYRTYQESKIHRASEKFWAVRSVQDMELIAEDFPSTQYASMALLGAAKEYFNSGRQSLAEKKYTEFLERYPDHYMADWARMGRLHCREAMGQTPEALNGFKEFAARNPDHYLTPQAILGQARCLEMLNRPEDAKAIFEEFIGTHTNSLWVGKAKENLKQLTRRMQKPAVSALAPAPIPAIGHIAAPTTNTMSPTMIDLSGFQPK